jgi:hypothetical protein
MTQVGAQQAPAAPAIVGKSADRALIQTTRSGAPALVIGAKLGRPKVAERARTLSISSVVSEWSAGRRL